MRAQHFTGLGYIRPVGYNDRQFDYRLETESDYTSASLIADDTIYPSQVTFKNMGITFSSVVLVGFRHVTCI